MGMFPSRYSNCSQAPDPKIFRIVTIKKIGKVWLSKINYPSASNFEGNKILITTFDPSVRKHLDPHFDKNSGKI